MKTMFMDTPTIKEVSILASINSQYIVRYKDSFIENGYLYLITEYCEKGDISTFLSSQMGIPLNENKIWKITIEILCGLATLHKYGIIHRDIKTKNIFLSRGYHIKIGDFGVRFTINQVDFSMYPGGKYERTETVGNVAVHFARNMQKRVLLREDRYLEFWMCGL